MSILEEIINELEPCDKKKILEEAIDRRLNSSLSLYTDKLSKDIDDVLSHDCMEIISVITSKYEKYDSSYKKLLKNLEENDDGCTY